MKHLIALLLLTGILGSSISSLQAKDSGKVYDAIIIPGFPFDPNGKVSMVYKMRLAWAYELYQQGRTEHIILSGGAVHSPFVEAEVFALYLMEMGIPADALILERKAEHSMENVFYAMEIANEYGYEKVAVATDLWQSGMIQIIGKVHGHDLSNVDFLPAKYSKIKHLWKSFEFEIDHHLAHVEDFVPLIERKDKKVRKLGTQGHLWEPSDRVELCFATEIR